MPLMYTRLAVGVDPTGGGLNLVVLSQRLRGFQVLGALRLPDASADSAPSRVSAFLKRRHAQEARVIACLPREDVLVRFMDLPAEAEAQLAHVVGYQIDSLHPFAEDQVYWDCGVISRRADGKQIRVLVVIAERSRLRSYFEVLKRLGLSVSCLTLSAACLGFAVKDRIPPTALVVCGRDQGLELVGFNQGRLSVTRDVPLEPPDGALDRFERELHSVRAFFDTGDSAEPPRLACGQAPDAFSSALEGAVPLPRPAMRLAQPADFDLGAYYTAFAAAYAGLARRPEPGVNLLPVPERWQSRRGLRQPLYVLGAMAALLSLAVMGHGWIENAFYSRALDREIARLAPQVNRVRRENQAANALEARAALLEDVRAGTWQKLEILQELTHLLPDGTWVSEIQLGEGTVEIFGESTRAADLVKPLEDSAFFSQVEFTSPITRNAQAKEIFRMRMRLRQPPRF